MKEFYLTLLSDSSLNTFANNRQSSFTVRLDHPIQIDKDNWEVGLVEIITPSEVKNVTDENNFFFLRFFDNGVQALKDITSGQNVKQVLKERGKSALKSFGQSTLVQSSPWLRV